MAISFSYQADGFELAEQEKVRQWISKTIVDESKRVGNISYLFCDDDYLIQVNRRYLNHDTYTDIITFDYVHCNRISGDIFISVDRVGENAEKYGVPFQQELLRVIIHGIHHLLGQGDKSESEAAAMRAKEKASLDMWNTML